MYSFICFIIQRGTALGLCWGGDYNERRKLGRSCNRRKKDGAKCVCMHVAMLQSAQQRIEKNMQAQGQPHDG